MSSYYGQELNSILELEPPAEITPATDLVLKPYEYYGLLIYPYRPDNIRIATLEDFYYSNGQLRLGMDFLVINHNDTFWEAHKVGTESVEKWSRFIEAGRTYI